MEIEVDGKMYVSVPDGDIGSACDNCDLAHDVLDCNLPVSLNCSNTHYVLKQPKEGNMKVTVQEKTECKGEYPKILRHENGAYVLFHHSHTGTVIKSDSNFYLGEISEEWDMSKFSPFPFHGTITIEVE